MQVIPQTKQFRYLLYVREWIQSHGRYGLQVYREFVQQTVDGIVREKLACDLNRILYYVLPRSTRASPWCIYS